MTEKIEVTETMLKAARRELVARVVRESLQRHVGPSAAYADEYEIAHVVIAALEAHTSHNAVELVEDFAAAFDDWLSEISGYGIEALFCSPEWSRVEQTRAALAGQQ
jgi:hypothetical protein